MIGIKKNSEYLDLLPNAQLQRERSSPVFLETTNEGKDGIPGEISYPFTLPLTDKNLRLLNFPDSLPMTKTLQHQVILEDSGMQLSSGKLVIDTVTAHLNKNNIGSIETHILSNISEFWQRVRDKKLSDLALGGNRSFSWAGYDLTTAGFWKHVHDSWAYTNADDGDYVFDPMSCKDYKTEGVITWINGWKEFSGVIQLAREENYYCLCPQPFLVYLIKQIFIEHGYSIEGAILNDPDFKQICLESYRSVDWAVPTINGPLATPTVTIAPKGTIIIKLNQHVPDMTVGEFLVELQKLVPIAFVIDDRARKCRIVSLSQLASAGALDNTKNFNPSFTLNFEAAGTEKIYGFERSDDNATTFEVAEAEYDFQGTVNSLTDLPAAAAGTQNDMYYIKYLNAYYACINYAELAGAGTFYAWLRVGHNVGAYLPENQTDVISSLISVSPIDAQKIFTGGTLGDVWGYFISAQRKGNWFAMDNDLEFTPWTMRIFFHRGKLPFHTGGNMPLATNGIYNFNSAYPLSSSHTQVGQWSLSYKVGSGNYGLIDHFWSTWLPVLQLNEAIKGRLYLKLQEYLQWDFDKIFLVHNTPYLIKKITEILPYPGYIDIEAQRI